MYTRLNQSIILKLLKIVFAIYFSVTLTATAFHLIAAYAEEKNQIIEQLKTLQKIFSPGLAAAIWDLNEAQIESILAGLKQSPILMGAKLEGQTPWGKQAWTVGTLPLESDLINLHSPNPLSVRDDLKASFYAYQFPIQYVTLDNEIWPIGQLSLYSSRDTILQYVKADFIIILINAIAKTIALWAFFLIAGQKFLSEPLERLTGAVEKIKLDDPNTFQIDAQIEGKNELKLLEQTFNNMTQKLALEMHQKESAEKALLQSKQELDDMFNSMPSALFGIDVNLNITHYNHTALQLTSNDYTSPQNLPITQAFPMLTEYLPTITQALRAQEPRHIHKIPKGPGPQAGYFDLTIYPLRNSEKSAAVLRLDDVTPQVQFESMMIQTEKMMSISGLAAGIAHEINNPLGIILQNAQNIERRLDPSLPKNVQVAEESHMSLENLTHYLAARQIPEFLTNIQTAGDRAAHIVKNMLQFSRSGAAESNEFIAVDVQPLVENALQLAGSDYDLKKRFDFRSIHIEKYFAESLPFVPCIPSEIEQVLLNLFKNAAHAMKEKKYADGEEPTITIATQLLKNAIEITISDNGPGMDNATQSRIFEPFFTTKPPGVGTGLGLSVSYFIITNNHQGEIRVEAQKNVGTTFIIRLPLQHSA